MLSPACERLASENQDLANLIRRIDSQLKSISLGSVIRAGEVASFLSAPQAQVTGILDRLVDYGELQKEGHIECNECGTLNDQDTYLEAQKSGDECNCSQCETELTERTAKPVTVYRKKQAAIVADNPKAHDTSKSVLPAPSITGFDEALTEAFLKNPFRYTALLRYYSQNPQLKELSPFSGKRVIFVLHFLRDLIPFVNAAMALGLQPSNATFFYKEYPYPQRRAIGDWLEKGGFKVLPVQQIQPFLADLAKLDRKEIGRIVIVEDGGYIVPRIHREFPELIPSTVGAVEQTTRGVRNSEEWLQSSKKALQIPVLSIATSQLKSEFEPKYIAKATVRSLNTLLPNLTLAGKKIAVLGCGTIGGELIDWLRKNGAQVTCYDPDNQKLLAQQQLGVVWTESGAEAVRNKHFVIGTTGKCSVDSQVISNLSHDCYLISTSSELYEIDLDELYQRAARKESFANDAGKVVGTDLFLPPGDRLIHLIANGYPINFWGMDSMPEEASDVIMSLILLAAVEVAAGRCKKNGIDSATVNELSGSKRFNIAQKFLEIHR